MQEFFMYGYLFKETWGTHFFLFYICFLFIFFTYIYTWWIEKHSENCSFGSSDRGSPQLITWCPPPAYEKQKCPICLQVCVCVRGVSEERCSASAIKASPTMAPLVSRSSGAHVPGGGEERTRTLLCQETEAEPTWPLLHQSHHRSGLRLRYPLSALWVEMGSKVGKTEGTCWQDRWGVSCGWGKEPENYNRRCILTSTI